MSLPELTDEELFNISAEPEIDLIRDMTPSAAIQQAIFDLCYQRRDWQDKDDPNGVRPWIDARLKNLEQAQRDLSELREIKKALAVLKAAI